MHAEEASCITPFDDFVCLRTLVLPRGGGSDEGGPPVSGSREMNILSPIIETAPTSVLLGMDCRSCDMREYHYTTEQTDGIHKSQR